MKRLFIAIPLSEELTKIAKACIDSVDGEDLRITKESNLHITACFLGNIEEKDIDELVEKLKLVSETILPFELTTKSVITAPAEKDPYMVWLDFNDSHCFNRLCATLDRYLLNESPKKVYLPHITLTRFKGFPPSFSNNCEVFSENADKLVLFESDTSGKSPVYTKIAEFGGV